MKAIHERQVNSMLQRMEEMRADLALSKRACAAGPAPTVVAEARRVNVPKPKSYVRGRIMFEKWTTSCGVWGNTMGKQVSWRMLSRSKPLLYISQTPLCYGEGADKRKFKEVRVLSLPSMSLMLSLKRSSIQRMPKKRHVVA